MNKKNFQTFADIIIVAGSTLVVFYPGISATLRMLFIIFAFIACIIIFGMQTFLPVWMWKEPDIYTRPFSYKAWAFYALFIVCSGIVAITLVYFLYNSLCVIYETITHILQ